MFVRSGYSQNGDNRQVISVTIFRIKLMQCVYYWPRGPPTHSVGEPDYSNGRGRLLSSVTLHGGPAGGGQAQLKVHKCLITLYHYDCCQLLYT